MPELKVVNLAQKFSLFADAWNPRIVGELNDTHIKTVKLQGEFVWHHHDAEDELFLVTRGTLRMRYQDSGEEHEVMIAPGEFVIVPRGVEHLPIADEEVHVVLIEPRSTLNTGNIEDEHTRRNLERI